MTATLAPAPSPLHGLAHQCFSGAARLDYLSSGLAAQASSRPRAVQRPAAARSEAEPGPEADAGLDADCEGRGEASDTAAGMDRLLRHYLAQVRRRGRLGSGAEYRLAKRAGLGDAQAARELAEHNLGLVVMIARRHARGPVQLLDLIQEGNLGLLQACSRFDPERGFRLATYAKWWVRQAIEMSLMTQSQAVRLSTHAARGQRRAERAARDGLGEGPAATPVLQVHSLDAEPALLEQLCADADAQPENQLWQGQRRQRLAEALAALPPAQRRVLALRYGLQGDEPQTLQAVATPLGLSCERVRQIEAEALKRLRALMHGSRLDAVAML